MLINKKMVRKNKALRAIQHEDKKQNRDRRLNRGSALKRNIEKVVALSSQSPIGGAGEGSGAVGAVSAKELIEKVDAAGLTGMSGSGFPTAEKLKAFLSADVQEKTILINGAECEPGLLNDAWLMREKAAEIIEGAAALKTAFSPRRVILASRGKAQYMTGMDTKGLQLMRLPLKYPMGEEHILIQQALGIKLDNSVLPTERGILVINVQTVYQIARILSGSYDGGRFVTLANLKTGEARIAYVHAGDSAEAALKQAFGTSDGEVYTGGGIGRAEKAKGGEVFDNTTSFAALSGEVRISNDNPCKKCGGCSKKCPMGVKMKDIVLAKQKDPKADISAFGADKCIHCGTCTYYCMAGKNPMGYITD